MTRRTHETAVAQVFKAFHTIEGDGFDVLRAIPSQRVESVGPVIFLDHFGPIIVKPGQAKGASAHPHAGIETLTLLLEGSSVHKDSMGNQSNMKPGEVQWFRAGRGAIHDESPDETMRQQGGQTHGVQLWFNMPQEHKHDEPEYQHYRAEDIPVLVAEDNSYQARVVAGQFADYVGPVKTYGHPLVVHASFSQVGELVTVTPQVEELAVYVMTGSVQVGQDGTRVVAGEIALLQRQDVLRLIHDQAQQTELVIIGGDVMRETLVRYGPFVMNSMQDIQQAARDYQMGRMGSIDP